MVDRPTMLSVCIAFVSLETNDLKVVFEYEHTVNAEPLLIYASFLNLSPEVMTEFMFQAAVPKVTSRKCEPSFILQSHMYLFFLLELQIAIATSIFKYNTSGWNCHSEIDYYSSG